MMRLRIRDALIQRAHGHPDWQVGFVDEVWFSRLSPGRPDSAQPSLSAGAEAGKELHLFEKTLPQKDKTARAIACYGLFLPEEDQMLMRFCAGRPVSALSCAFLEWACERLGAQGKRVLVVFWDNASWHISKEVRAWIRAHNRSVKQAGAGLRLLVHRLPSKSPWLNRIEPKWVHGKRAVLEPQRILSAQELSQRVYDYYGSEQHPWLQ